MLGNILSAISDFGVMVSESYTDISSRWLRLLLLPLYIVFVILHITVITILMTIYMIEGKIRYDITFREDLEALKEGFQEGLDKIKG